MRTFLLAGTVAVLAACASTSTPPTPRPTTVPTAEATTVPVTTTTTVPPTTTTVPGQTIRPPSVTLPHTT